MFSVLAHFTLMETKALPMGVSKVMHMHLGWFLLAELHGVAYPGVNLVKSFKIGPQLQNGGKYEGKFFLIRITLMSVDFWFHFAV